jgi:hypothetical protein
MNMDYTEPGPNERTVSINGWFLPDDPGAVFAQKAKADPIAMRFRIEPNRWRSVAWWLTGWWPKRARVWLCDRFGHPESCTGVEHETHVVPVNQSFSGGEYTVSFEQLEVLEVVKEWCVRCGATLG